MPVTLNNNRHSKGSSANVSLSRPRVLFTGACLLSSFLSLLLILSALSLSDCVSLSLSVHTFISSHHPHNNTTQHNTITHNQIYNENISDLLKPERVGLPIRDHPQRGLFVEGLSEWVVRSPEEVYGSSICYLLLFFILFFFARLSSVSFFIPLCDAESRCRSIVCVCCLCLCSCKNSVCLLLCLLFVGLDLTI